MSLPNVIGDWNVGTFNLDWNANNVPDAFRERAKILTQDTSPITLSDCVALSGTFLEPMVRLLNARNNDVFVRLFVAADRGLGHSNDTAVIIEGQFLPESPVVYVIEQRRVEDRGYEQIKGTMLAVTNFGADLGTGK
jgi:hypothetical protein